MAPCTTALTLVRIMLCVLQEIYVVLVSAFLLATPIRWINDHTGTFLSLTDGLMPSFLTKLKMFLATFAKDVPGAEKQCNVY